MPSNRKITPSALSVKDLPWQILWDKRRCTLCGQCTAVCPVQAIEPAVFRKRIVNTVLNTEAEITDEHTVYYGIRQKTDPAYACVGCATCQMVCPNDAIIPIRGD